MRRSAWPVRAGLSLLTAVTVGGLGVPAEAAAAGVASVSRSTRIQYTGSRSARHDVVVTRSGRTVTIDDRVAITAGKGCKRVKGDKTKVRCTTRTDPTLVTIVTGDRADRIVNDADLRLVAHAGAGKDRIVGGPRGDDLTGDGGADQIYGMGGGDDINGATGADLIYGGPGNDDLYGGDGNDRLYGQAGEDFIVGAEGADLLYGGADGDILGGSEGRDRFYGEGGDDQLMATDWDFTDADYFSGGPGDDSVDYSNYERPITADADGVTGDDGAKTDHDTIATDVEAIYGGSRNDRLYGTSRAESLDGGDGDDLINGGGGDDRLRGGPGRDRLNGGPGDDELSGDEDGYAAAADRLDGGPDGTAAGDLCEAFRGDTKANCER